MPKYKPQPYAHLARVLGSQCQPEDAREVLVAKQDKELEQRKESILNTGLLRALARPSIYVASFVLGWMFGYGLKPKSAFAMIVLAIALGSCVIFAANQRGLMVVDQQAIANAVQGERKGAVEAPGAADDKILCADAINAVLYAIDVFIPLVDLRQESKCEIDVATGTTQLFLGISIGGGYTYGSEVEIYRGFKVVYALAGSLIISPAILTFSGVLQRRDEK